MKRLFCLLLTGIVLISLTSCSSNNSHTDNKLGDPDTTTNSSNFDPVDLSCENVAQLTAFKCYAAYRDRTITIDGTRAKDLYNLVYNATREQEYAPASSYGNYVYLVFYNSEEEYPSENINTNIFWGTYTIYDDGLLVFSGSPYHSAAFDYKLESDIYNSVIDIISDDN